ncbi:MAG: hypothetical protein ACRERE_23685 [Candidatus Entotheonellia bacterium]
MHVHRRAVRHAGRAADALDVGCLIIDGYQVYDFRLEGCVGFFF